MAVLNFTEHFHFPMWATADNIPPLLTALTEENTILDRVIYSLVEKSENYPAILETLDAINLTMASALERIAKNELAIAVLQPDEVRGMRETIQALEKKVKTNADNISTFNIRLQNMEACYKTITNRLDNVDAEIAKITNDIIETGEKISELDERLTTEINAIKARLDKVETWERRILILEKNLDAALTDIAKNAESISTNAEIILNHEDRITALEDGEGGGLADVKNQIAAVVATADAIGEEISLMKDDISTNANNITTITDDITLLGDKVEANRSNLNAFGEVVENNNERVNDAVERLEGAEAVVNEHTAVIEDQSARILSNSAGVAQNAVDIDEIKDRLDDAETEIDNRVKLV